MYCSTSSVFVLWDGREREREPHLSLSFVVDVPKFPYMISHILAAAHASLRSRTSPVDERSIYSPEIPLVNRNLRSLNNQTSGRPLVGCRIGLQNGLITFVIWVLYCGFSVRDISGRPRQVQRWRRRRRTCHRPRPTARPPDRPTAAADDDPMQQHAAAAAAAARVQLSGLL